MKVRVKSRIFPAFFMPHLIDGSAPLIFRAAKMLGDFLAQT
jgi:hypothetical protein